jgi:hypothetical protein
MLGRYQFDSSLGIVGVSGGKLLSASGVCRDKSCTGSVRLAVPDDKLGLRIEDAKP